MSKDFKPIFGGTDTGVSGQESFEDKLQRLLKEKAKQEKRLKELEALTYKLSEENKRLKEDLSSLSTALQEKESQIQALSDSLKTFKNEHTLVKELKAYLETSLENVKEQLLEDFVSLSKEVIREFLMTDMIPKEEVVARVLRDVFENMVELRGSVKISMNPIDVEKIYEFIANLRKQFGDRLELNVVTDEGLEEGEIRVETPRFVIERKNQEMLEEVFREVMGRVLKGS